MPLCLVFERKEGTVCRAGLDRRVQSKCFVAELLSREQKVAHIVVVSFPLHQIKTFFFFFFFSLGGRACSSWTHAGGWNETSAAAKKKKKKILAFQYSTFWNTSSNRQNEVWCFVVSDKQCWAVYCQALSTPNQTSCFQPSQRLMGSSDGLRGKHRQVYCPRPSCHVNTSTYSLVCVHINYTSEKIQVAGEYLAEGQNWCKGRRANLSQDRVLSERRGGTEILYLTPCMLQPVWKTALINWLHRGMKLLFEEIMVHTAQHSVELKGFFFFFYCTEMKLLSAARAGRWC